MYYTLAASFEYWMRNESARAQIVHVNSRFCWWTLDRKVSSWYVCNCWESLQQSGLSGNGEDLWVKTIGEKPQSHHGAVIYWSFGHQYGIYRYHKIAMIQSFSPCVNQSDNSYICCTWCPSICGESHSLSLLSHCRLGCSQTGGFPKVSCWDYIFWLGFVMNCKLKLSKTVIFNNTTAAHESKWKK